MRDVSSNNRYDKAMNGIKIGKWQYFLMLFLVFLLGRLVIDCLYKIGMPFRTVLELILKNAVLPAITAALILFLHWTRDR